MDLDPKNLPLWQIIVTNIWGILIFAVFAIVIVVPVVVVVNNMRDKWPDWDAKKRFKVIAETSLILGIIALAAWRMSLPILAPL
ncbi:MAG: hypothetical protein RLZZ626_212 [Actinomycetota bacterium]